MLEDLLGEKRLKDAGSSLSNPHLSSSPNNTNHTIEEGDEEGEYYEDENESQRSGKKSPRTSKFFNRKSHLRNDSGFFHKFIYFLC